MRNAFSPTAPVTFLDAEAVRARLRRASEALCARDSNVLGVLLFGSLATGTATPGSDADLLVLLRSDARRVVDRIPDYSRPFEMPGFGVDVWPWTQGELGRRLRGDDRFARELLETGLTLAGTITPA